MGDLIWVGNTLLPRGVVILAVVLTILAMVGTVALLRRFFKDGHSE